jgi:MFS family permease
MLAAGVAFLSILVVLPAQEQRRPPKVPNLGQIGRLVSRRDVFLPAALNAVAQYANWTATFSFFPILARQLGASDVVLSLLLSVNIGVVMVGNLTTTMLIKRFGSRRFIYLSFGLLALGLCLAAVAPVLWLVFVAQFCMGLASGMGYPVLMGKSIEYVAERERTTAMGLHQAVYAIGMFAGPWLSGVLADATGLRPMFAVTAVASLLLGLWGTRQLDEPTLSAERVRE